MVRLVPAVGQDVLGNAAPRQCPIGADLLGMPASSDAEGFGLHDDEIEVGFRRRVAPRASRTG